MNLQDKVREIISVTAGQDVSIDDRFEHLPIDSLEFVAMIQEIEGEFGVKVEEEDIARMKTVNDLFLCVRGLIGCL